jgi:hypothetical protein
MMLLAREAAMRILPWLFFESSERGMLGRVDGFDQDEGECERHE